jgi:hypothetical protein
MQQITDLPWCKMIGTLVICHIQEDSAFLNVIQLTWTYDSIDCRNLVKRNICNKTGVSDALQYE